MKAARFICLALFGCSLLIGYAVDAPAAPQATKDRQKAGQSICAKDKNGITICQRLAPEGRIQGHTGVYTQKTAKGKTPCKWKCTTAGGLETCTASGSECDGKSPPHWR